MEFRCIRKCQYKGKIYLEGAKLISNANPVPCPECGGAGKKDGTNCPKCHGTGRIDPPHHFVSVEPVTKPVDPEVEETIIDEERERVRDEFREIGAAFDPRWGIPRLKNELIRAKKEKGVN